MLTHLSVQNYALIDRLEIDFSKGLTIITGETGAGKSILLGALGLITGNRADSQVLQDKTKKCVVEAQFDIAAYSIQGFFKQNELDFEKIATVRREINPEGKSRAFINDTPVTLAVLKELGEELIDIHSQHQTLTINGSAFQTAVVDAFAGNTGLLENYGTDYRNYRALEKKLQQLKEQESQAKKEIDYLQFQFNELNELSIRPGEQESMEEELAALNHAEEIKAGLSKAAYGLDGAEESLISKLAEVKSILASISKFKPEINEIAQRINSVHIEVKDLLNELESTEQAILYDPAKIELLNERLDQLYRLQQKHQLNSVEELLQLKETIGNQLDTFGSLESQIDASEKELSALKRTLDQQATQLSARRKKALPAIEKEVGALLQNLSMPNAQLRIQQELLTELTPSGTDKINFLFSANKGSDFKELNKVASGGELSRLMLSIKSMIAKLLSLPTILFDEIDTGVSGDVADKVGSIMNQMAEAMQVIVITHLPQIASKGKNHLFVYKEDKGNKTFSNIRALKPAERVEEIAKMLSTGKPTAAAISNAKELLNES